ncbi:MAG: hypothetical protein V4550_08625 [Gemmatimonadota bacterium]
MRTLAAICCCLAAAACASNSGLSSTSEGTLRAAGGGGAGGLTMRSNDGAQFFAVPYSAANVWAVLPAIYDSLSLPLSEVDEKTRVIATSGAKVHKNLGTTNLGKFIDCGSAQGFPSADSYDVRLSVRTQVEQQPDGTAKVGTLLEAMGRPMTVSGAFVRCTSKYELEKRILESVKGRLKG